MTQFYSKIYKLTLFVLLSLPLAVCAQSPTFYEGFDDTPIGELPEGWTWYQEGGADPLAHWTVSTYGWFGPKTAFSGLEGALPGMVDQDWLITPQITPVAGDFLIFDAAQTYTGIDYGTKYHVLVSTTTTDPAAFTDTLATYNETEFPKYMETVWFDLAAYADTPIYIAFIHETTSTDGNQTDDWYLDNVWVRPVQEAAFHNAQVSWQFSVPIRIGKAANTPMLGFKVTIKGDMGSSNLSGFRLTTKGTSDNLKITEATLYTTHDVPFISYGDYGVDADTFGSTLNPADTFEIMGNQDLTIGDNYFWLTYSYDTTLVPEFPYPRADASLEKVFVDGSVYGGVVDTVVVSPHIVPDEIPNDMYADAIEISPVSGRYGSYNQFATVEPEHEQLAYCAPGGTQDTGNSIWWYFVAPSDGYIAADLSETDFNTILVFMDKNSDQLGCNNDIDPGLEVQSRITDFPVTEGQEIYIRVTGVGDVGDPNGEAGIVAMDFTFTSLVSGIDNWGGSTVISPVYPNPSSGLTSFDIKPKINQEVAVRLLDMVGHPVRMLYQGQLAGGEKHTINFDTSDLPAGTYMLQVLASDGVEGIRRLVVTH